MEGKIIGVIIGAIVGLIFASMFSSLFPNPTDVEKGVILLINLLLVAFFAFVGSIIGERLFK